LKANELNAEILNILSRQIYRYRREAELTQDQLSERCGIYRTYLSRIENGTANPSLMVIAALATNLSVPISKLLMEEDN
jgi:transcriptional regulator with XRE-family HTH domain